MRELFSSFGISSFQEVVDRWENHLKCFAREDPEERSFAAKEWKFMTMELIGNAENEREHVPTGILVFDKFQ